MDTSTAFAFLVDIGPLLHRIRDSFGADAAITFTLAGHADRSDTYDVRIELPLGACIDADMNRLLDNGHGEPIAPSLTEKGGRRCTARGVRSLVGGVRVAVVEYAPVRQVTATLAVTEVAS